MLLFNTIPVSISTRVLEYSAMAVQGIFSLWQQSKIVTHFFCDTGKTPWFSNQFFMPFVWKSKGWWWWGMHHCCVEKQNSLNQGFQLRKGGRFVSRPQFPNHKTINQKCDKEKNQLTCPDSNHQITFKFISWLAMLWRFSLQEQEKSGMPCAGESSHENRPNFFCGCVASLVLRR